jgi:hypothetical protein
MSSPDDLKPQDTHSDRIRRNEDRIDWYGKRKTFAEEAREITEEMKVEVARVIRETMKSPN